MGARDQPTLHMHTAAKARKGIPSVSSRGSNAVARWPGQVRARVHGKRMPAVRGEAESALKANQPDAQGSGRIFSEVAFATPIYSSVEVVEGP